MNSSEDSNPGMENLADLARLRLAADAGQAEAIFQVANHELNAGRFEESIRRWQQLVQIVPIDRAALGPPELLEKSPTDSHAF